MGLNEKSKLSDELAECKAKLQQAESERDELKVQLRETSKKLADSEAFKSHFIARISNEIINPFTSIIASSENLLKKKQQPGSHEMIRMVDLIHNEALFLDFQLKNLFTAARIEAGELIPETVNSDLNQLITESVKGFLEEAERREIELIIRNHLPDDARLKTDPALLNLVIKNLISNALKFSNKKTKVELTAELKKGAFLFTIQNEGDSIDGEKLEVIFDRFRQLDSKIHSLNPGSGIGLSVAREVLDLINGSIEAKPLEDGMKFMVKVEESEYGDEITQDDDSLFFDGEQQEDQSF
jgi:signal transduction histidine kinase